MSELSDLKNIAQQAAAGNLEENQPTYTPNNESPDTSLTTNNDLVRNVGDTQVIINKNAKPNNGISTVYIADPINNVGTSTGRPNYNIDITTGTPGEPNLPFNYWNNQPVTTPINDQMNGGVKPSMLCIEDPSILETVTSPTEGMPNTEPPIKPEELDMLKQAYPDKSEDEINRNASSLLKSFNNIKKELIINVGLTPEEAITATINRIKKDTSSSNVTEDEKQSVAEVIIDKSADVNDLGLTKEEHMKLQKVKKVNLIVIDDIELASIDVERPAENHKIDYIKSIEGTLSKYGVPLPTLGDFVLFKGAQILQMANLVNYEDSSSVEILSTRASFIYDKLLGGSVLKKYDENGKVIMQYNEFINKFPYFDMNMAIFGILCASSAEEQSTSMECTSCKHTYDQTYNVKQVLKNDNIPDNFKDRIDNILGYKNNPKEIKLLYDNLRKATRYKSPFTNNIYEISYPSIARAIEVMGYSDKNENKSNNYAAPIAMYLSNLYIFNPNTGKYIQISSDELDTMIETLSTLTNDDFQLILKQVREYIYEPAFAIKATCPSCGATSTLDISIDDLIFLRAQDLPAEILG